MEVLLLTVFVSLVLAGLGVCSFVWSARSRTFEHSDRLSILPLEDEMVAAPRGVRPGVGRPSSPRPSSPRPSRPRPSRPRPSRPSTPGDGESR